MTLSFACFSASAAAQELLANRSFETPVAPVNGNNLYATIPDWTIINVTPAQAQPWNIVKPWLGYVNNPTATPTGGGTQYLDINTAAGTIIQTIIVPSQGMVDFSGWFAVRDFPQALTGLTINIRNSGGTLVGTASTSFAVTDPIGLWKQVSNFSIPVGAGTYTFEVDIPNFANFDLASLVFKPAPALTKVSAAYSDPVNGTTNPKEIPGGIVEYTIAMTSPASYAVSNNTIVLTDITPVGSELIVADIGAAGSGPAAFAPGSTGMTYGFSGLGNTTDNIDFSNDGGANWAYTPVANGNGADPSVTTVRVRPQGTMAAGSSLTVRLRYRIK